MNNFPIRNKTPCLILVGALYAISAMPSLVQAKNQPAYGTELEGFTYTYPVKHYSFSSQDKSVRMAYVDVPAAKGSTAKNRAVVLMHGKLFCADTWSDTIKTLSREGFRVIAPDQIGFCKSTKPQGYQYSFQQLASNTHALLQSLGVTRSTVIGHSMGGMLATRYALMYPDATEHLALVNPLGLEDWKALGVPYLGVDGYYAEELETSAQELKTYQQRVHYNGEWRPEFDRWVEMQAGMFGGPGLPLIAHHAALTYDMIFNQPVFYEFENLKVPATLFIGLTDRTAITHGASPATIARLANYPELGKSVAKRIPRSTLVEFDDLGHSPHLQAPQRFYPELLKAINK
ncbi:alpha/beta fold hydrolase [Pseudomonas gingeri]|uniref:Alpha/beta hydrolase n=2 Tax=Pseudomonas gingeri TaxID=117681 RepID=A0A7Y7Y4L8_9PSED|nr:alpha/beta hydrolase [Pseudomonas gingeri]